MLYIWLLTDARSGSGVGVVAQSRQGSIIRIISRLWDAQTANQGHSLSAQLVADVVSREPAVCRWTTNGPCLDVQAYGDQWMSDDDIVRMKSRPFNNHIRSLHPDVQSALRQRRRTLLHRAAAKNYRQRRQQEVRDLRERLNNMRVNHPRITTGSPEPWNADESSVDSIRVNVGGSPPTVLSEDEEAVIHNIMPIHMELDRATVPTVLVKNEIKEEVDAAWLLEEAAFQ